MENIKKKSFTREESVLLLLLRYIPMLPSMHGNLHVLTLGQIFMKIHSLVPSPLFIVTGGIYMLYTMGKKSPYTYGHHHNDMGPHTCHRW